jgi:hypothetical protein
LCNSPKVREAEIEENGCHSTQTQHPALIQLARPKYAGKQIHDEAIQAYYESTRKEQEMFGRETIEEAEERVVGSEREPLTLTDEDKLHYVYCVKRMQWGIHHYESNADWFAVQTPAYYSLGAANSAVHREILVVRGGLALDPSCEEQRSFKNDDGMAEWFIRLPQGYIRVKVERTLRCKGEGKLPDNKIGWLSKKVYLIKKKISVRHRRNPISIAQRAVVVSDTDNIDDFVRGGN